MLLSEHLYQKKIADIFKILQTDPDIGLNKERAKQRYLRQGLNRLKRFVSPSIFVMLYQQFKNPLMLMTLMAMILSIVTFDTFEASIYLSLLAVNVALGIYQENKLNASLLALNEINTNKCEVMRNGRKISIFAENLVKGDIIFLKTGNTIPADVRLIEIENFRTNEFFLTGSLEPVVKDQGLVTDKILPLAERVNCAFMGTTVVSGSATAIVYAIGRWTEMGKISAESSKTRKKAAIDQEVNYFSTLTGWTFVGLFIFQVISIFFFETGKWTLELFFGHGGILSNILSVSTSVIPLTMYIQINLILGITSQNCLKRNILSKKVSTLDTLAAANTIVFDKTATITIKQPVIVFAMLNGFNYETTGHGFDPKGEVQLNGKAIKVQQVKEEELFLLAGYFASNSQVCQKEDSWEAIGDSIDAAFAVFSQKMAYSLDKIDKKYQNIAVFEFDSQLRRMAGVRKYEDKYYSFVKGSLESVMSICNRYIHQGRILQMSKGFQKDVFEQAEPFLKNTLSVMGLAYQEQPYRKTYSRENAENNLIFIGFVAINDPPQQGILETIETLKENQIKLVLLTGDHAVSAESLAREIGMTDANGNLPKAITGNELTSRTETQLLETIRDQKISIFARNSPEEKLRVIELLKLRGDHVVMVGDGVNDVLAFNKSDISVAVGKKGTKAAIDSADMVLLDDKVSNIWELMKDGKQVYKNLEKTIIGYWVCNFAELCCALWGFIMSVFMDWEIVVYHGLKRAYEGISPMMNVQILCIDLVAIILPLLALTYDPLEDESQNINIQKRITVKKMISVAKLGFMMGTLCLIAFHAIFWYTERIEEAQGVCFVSLILMQFINILHQRTTKSIFTNYLFSNKILLAALGIAFSLTLCLLYAPIKDPLFSSKPNSYDYLGTGTLGIIHWVAVLVVSALFLLWCEFVKKLKISAERYEN
ncbi:MAG: cation-transporting P-type ATPase [Bacteroidetes bacterium]|nr:MAG: cation-transporting P-type ATPase [Bacteroidota bacterium]